MLCNINLLKIYLHQLNANIEKKLMLLNLMSIYYNLSLRKIDVSDYVTAL